MGEDNAAGAEWSRYWSGRSSTDDPEVYARHGFEADEELKEFWAGIISALPKTTEIVDLACGSGAVLRHATRLGYPNLTGVDIAPNAIEMMKLHCPGAKGIVSSAEDLPLADQSADLVVSQFGFEYAGVRNCLPDIVRILKPGGKLVAIIHMTEGAIARECEENRQSCAALEETGFIPAAIEVFRAFDAVDKTGTDAARAHLNEVSEAAIAPKEAITKLAASGHTLAAHTMSGTQLMFQRRRFYVLADIVDWLERVRKENLAHGERMQGMVNAALSREQIEDRRAQLRELGLEPAEVETLMQGNPAEPIGWILQATKLA
ncbi:MAG: hypothetical protein CMK07_14770 [Ponticaulis sp.]|nr:hypothetical protein [Ponticaulis sp.]